MRSDWTETIKKHVRPTFYRLFGKAMGASYQCPICQYEGPFKDKVVQKRPRLVREASKCPGCASAERHRLMYLVIKDLAEDLRGEDRSVLHVAPEACLQENLEGLFGTYHSMDLFRDDVMYREDLQAMSFASGSYDAVVVSRVLISPPDLEACLRECRRVLKPGGVFIIAELYPRAVTEEYEAMRGDRHRELGVDVLDRYRAHFDEVDLYDSERYPESFQLYNLMRIDGRIQDEFPDEVRAPGRGLKDVVAVCRVQHETSR